MTQTTDATTDLTDFGDSDLDWGDSIGDDAPLACGLENPDECEACQ